MRSKFDRRRATLLVIIVADVLLLASAVYFNFIRSSVPTNTVQLTVSAAGEDSKPVSIPIDKYPYVSIPKIAASSHLNDVGVTQEGNMDVPKSPLEAGIFTGGAGPGQKGTAVVAGHVTNYGKKAIFTDLHKLAVGDFVYIMSDSKTTYKYEVIGSEEYDIDNAPLQKIFGATEDATLNLITCSGDWDKGRDTYKKRLVVFTKLVTAE